jgi:hypothetical protein
MENVDRKLIRSIKRATILSGIGMGLLLGLIMGLSVSEVVKVIMAALTTLLGAFLGFEKSKYTGMDNAEYNKEGHSMLFTALRAGWFGIAVAAGLIIGMIIRTNEIFTPSISKSVKEWTDAGFDTQYARQIVVFSRLGINPKSGEVGALTEVQRVHQSNLFSSETAQSLCADTDPDQWSENWELAKNGLKDLKGGILVTVVDAIEANVPTDQRFAILKGLNSILCYMGKTNSNLCDLGPNLQEWHKNPETEKIADLLSSLPKDRQQKLLSALANLICKLEKDIKQGV